MATSLHILVVEDSEDDTFLMQRQLLKSGYNPLIKRVDNEQDLQDALSAGQWDIAITDHNLPGYSSSQAIKTIKAYDLDLPIIIVSGSIGEDIAVAAMKAGANDYIMKSNLPRLIPAINRELREAESRQARRRAEETIRHMAFHDSLTGLINRAEFEQRLKHALHTLHSQDQSHALLYIDLDQFKIINDTCGHVAGDQLLKQLTVILHQQIRESDTLARLGGDEFGLLLEKCPIDKAMKISEKILKTISGFHFAWQTQTFTIGASIGLVMINDTMQTMSDVLSSADMACYAAKESGRNRVHLYREDDSLLIRRHGEMQWVIRINDALQQDAFCLYMQEIRSIEAGRDSHYEFLVRLKDKDEIILPGAFIPAAERYNLMPAIDRWVVRHALLCIDTLTAGNKVGKNSIFFINLSGMSLSDDSLFEHLESLFKEYADLAPRICFEITETAAISNLPRAVTFIKEIKSYGCKFALDDFGAGLSSFSYLKTLPVDYIKIDGGFVRDMLVDQMDAVIVEAISKIGQVAGLITIAEFVENMDLFDAVQECGIDYAQGFGLHVPELCEPDLNIKKVSA